MADEAIYRLEPLGSQHDRETFTCGAASLDQYLRTQASQDMRRKANAVFALVPADAPQRVAGYFTLCAYAIAPGTIPEAARRYIPKYPAVSATLIGRLAIGDDFQGRALGSRLLVMALVKAYENASVVGSSMAVVDALDERVSGFYQAHGFIKLQDSMRLMLPMRAIAEIAKTPERH